MLSPETADILAVILGFGLFGLIVMTTVSYHWKTLRGWLIISYVFIPGFVLVAAVLINYPPLLFGALFFLGVAATGGKRRR
ncbi:hypothetical protein [Halomonas sp.]|uniref:hypothetical protein n=1 Tax=unclassified Halomonas TaxID=2609666 RepID=UPI003F90287F